MIKLTESNFENEVIKSDKPVLVDFYSDTCMPCIQLMPVLEELESEYKNKFKIVKVNIADSYSLFEKYNVNVSPTLLFFKDSEEKERIRGLVDKKLLSDKMDKIIY